VTRPDISTQVRFRKEEELRKDEAALRATGRRWRRANVKILTSCPSCLQGLSRYGTTCTTACWRPTTSWSKWPPDPGRDWLPSTWPANAGGIERVLV
jgi:hypothetical protein